MLKSMNVVPYKDRERISSSDKSEDSTYDVEYKVVTSSHQI